MLISPVPGGEVRDDNLFGLQGLAPGRSSMATSTTHARSAEAITIARRLVRCRHPMPHRVTVISTKGPEIQFCQMCGAWRQRNCRSRLPWPWQLPWLVGDLHFQVSTVPR